jgi:hypothetical protein
MTFADADQLGWPDRRPDGSTRRLEEHGGVIKGDRPSRFAGGR